MSVDRDRIAWADFRKAITRIREEIHIRKNATTETTLGQIDGLEMALTEMEDAFQHIHVKRDGDDICALCDLDLRNPIHHRRLSAGEQNDDR